MEIINSEEVIVHGKKYKQIIYSDGSAELKGFDDEYKMWVTLKFTNDDDDERVVNNIIETAINVL